MGAEIYIMKCLKRELLKTEQIMDKLN